MAERVEIESKGEKYFIRPPKEQKVVCALLADNSSAKGVVFIIPRDREKVVREAHDELTKILEKPDLAIVDGKMTRLTGNIASYLIPPAEVIGPERLVENSEV